MDAFLLRVAQRYDVKGKFYFNYPNKYYYTDIGLRNARLNYRQYDPGHIMENIIYNDLIRRGYDKLVPIWAKCARRAKSPSAVKNGSRAMSARGDAACMDEIPTCRPLLFRFRRKGENAGGAALRTSVTQNHF